jgi:hypothetical protein
VTDLVQGLKQRAESLTEDQIAYIIRQTVEVTYIGLALQLSTASSPHWKKKNLNTVYSCVGMDGHLKDGRTDEWTR